MSRFQITCPIFVLALFCSACSDPSSAPEVAETDTKEVATTEPEQTKTDSASEKTEEKPEASSEDESPLTMPIVRETLAGNWILVFTQGGTDYSTSLFEISPSKETAESEDPQFDIKLLEISSALPGADLKEVAVMDNQVQVDFDIEGTAVDFEGTFEEGIIYGSVVFGKSRCDVARMIPTDVKDFEDIEIAQPSAGREEMLEIDDDDDRVKEMVDFAKTFSKSPLAIIAYQQAIAYAKEEDVDEAGLEEITSKYHSTAAMWGERMLENSRVDVAYLLSMNNYSPEVALKYQEAAEKGLKAESLSGLQEQLKSSRQKILTNEAMGLIASDDDTKRKDGATKLRKINESAAFDPLVTFALAKFDKEDGNIDDAIDAYAALAVLPQVEQVLQMTWARDEVDNPLPSETVARLWKEKHKNTEGLDAFLDEVYSSRIGSFADERVGDRAEGEGNQTVLCELFTGAQCPPCMPADVATIGIEKTFPKSQVIMLRYHEHIPGPDPLANEDGEARFFNFYRGQGTPYVFVNGVNVPGIGGMQLSDAKGLYQRLRDVIDPMLALTTEVKVEASAVAADGEIKISANVSGLEEVDENLRLWLVLAEDEVSFVASNGIRQHEMTVRQLVGGDLGVSPQEGALKHTETINLAAFKERISSYLEKFEQGQGVLFSAKPMELKHLHLVAFVQDNVTKKILQSVAVPVTGTIEYSEAAPSKETKKADPKKAAEEKKPESDKKPADDKKPAADSDSKPKTESKEKVKADKSGDE